METWCPRLFPEPVGIAALNHILACKIGLLYRSFLASTDLIMNADNLDFNTLTFEAGDLIL